MNKASALMSFSTQPSRRQISEIALMVPDEPIAVFQPAER
jgi:hypothetical protein